MRGSIRKRGSTYTYILDMPPDPVTGQRRQRTKGGFRTKRECQAALNEAVMAIQTGTFVEATNPPSPWIGSIATQARLSAPICFSITSIARTAASSPDSPSRNG